MLPQAKKFKSLQYKEQIQRTRSATHFWIQSHAMNTLGP